MKHHPYDPEKRPSGFHPPERIPRIDGYRGQVLLADGTTCPAAVVGWQDDRARIARLRHEETARVINPSKVQGWYLAKQVNPDTTQPG